MWRKVYLIVLQNEFVHESLEQIVDVVAAKVGVAVRREHLIDIAIASGNKLEDGDIKRAAAKIINRDFAALLFVQAVSKSGCRRLIDEAEDFKTSNFTGVLGGLALGIVEIRGHGNDGAVDGLAEKSFRPVFQFAKDEGGDFRRRENPVTEHDANDVFACRIDAERKKLQL